MPSTFTTRQVVELKPNNARAIRLGEKRPVGLHTRCMSESDDICEVVFREGTGADIAACVSLWVEACATRDGRSVAGVADRARPKFDQAEAWILAEHPEFGVLGFVLATPPGSGLPLDPADAPLIGLLAVASAIQGLGLGGTLLDAMIKALARLGYPRAVLHVLADNHSAVRLYSSKGWRPEGAPFQHSLLKRPTQTYSICLVQPSD
jgi:ribosomal protein S18 acetylase RimI-like enzyme